jgi:hypothetical protein
VAAAVRLNWNHVDFVASEVSGWVQFRKAVNIDEHPGLLSQRAVYVIRIREPFAFDYEDAFSPVAYIGKGQAQQRITSHLKSWIPQLSKRIPGLKIRIYYCEPKVRRLGKICEGVEADLIERFVTRYGRRPLRNRNTPTHPGSRTYTQSELHVLHPGKGRRYHWALRPLPSCHFYG